MTLSVWRYSHLVLAIASSVFLLIASVTGVILAVEPVAEKLQGYDVDDADQLSVAQVMDNLNSEYDEVLSISRDANGFVSATVVTNGRNETFYVDPFTGAKLGEIPEKAEIFKFSTNLHRSLFLKTPGRFFVGLVSFLLVLIAISGIVLIAKRQGGITRFFSAIVKENFSQYSHIVTARIVLIPIVIISISGVYLSLLRFSIIPDPVVTHELDYDTIAESPQIPAREFDIFENSSLAELRELEYPFSEFPEDTYQLKLDDREMQINQYTGEILSEQEYPFVSVASGVATVLHTGQGSILWSIVLGLATLSIPFLIISGFVISLKRPGVKFRNSFSKDRSKFVILVGTEGGTTLQFAKNLHKALLEANQSCFIAGMNDYDSYKEMEHLVVLTSTYGQGEAPSNAGRFREKFSAIQQRNPYTFSVVGFGSTAYPDFCRFAYDTEKVLQTDPKSKRLMEVHTVNNQSFESFRRWAEAWTQKVGVELKLEKPASTGSLKKTTSFKVVNKNGSLVPLDNTFLLQLESLKGKKYESGDLLAVFPSKDTSERLYSIGKISKRNMLISVKKHEHGLCSNYLHDLEPGQQIDACLIQNKTFRFPKKTKKVVMVCTGTGIGPFLGMIANNHKRREIHLYWGARTPTSLDLYSDIINDALLNGKLAEFKPAYSRKDKQYVQHLLERDKFLIAKVLEEQGAVMICGSIAMQKEVLELLNNICGEILRKDLSYYQNRKQIRMDCY